MVIFHSYVKLPEGRCLPKTWFCSRTISCWVKTIAATVSCWDTLVTNHSEYKYICHKPNVVTLDFLLAPSKIARWIANHDQKWMEMGFSPSISGLRTWMMLWGYLDFLKPRYIYIYMAVSERNGRVSNTWWSSGFRAVPMNFQSQHMISSWLVKSHEMPMKS